MTQQKSILLQEAPASLWKRCDESIFLLSRLSLARNIAPFSFPPTLGDSDKKQLFQLLNRTIQSLYPSLKLYEGNQLTGEEKQWISEYFFLREPINQLSHFEAIAQLPNSPLLILLNLNDHLTLHFTRSGNTLRSGQKKILQLQQKIGQTLEFAFSSRFGFLTSQPKDCGTALKQSALLHLPLSLSKLPSFEKEKKSLFSNVTGERFGPSHDPQTFFKHSLVRVESEPAQGYNEDQSLLTLEETCMKLQFDEIEQRKMIKETLPSEIKNAVARSYGLLKHSLSLSHDELIEMALSLKLGVDLDLVHGIKHQHLNQVFFTSSATLLTFGNSDQLEVERLRITHAQRLLKRLRLNI